MRKVFISYRSLDAQVAEALADCVKSVGADIYLDQRDAMVFARSAIQREGRGPCSGARPGQARRICLRERFEVEVQFEQAAEFGH